MRLEFELAYCNVLALHISAIPRGLFKQQYNQKDQGRLFIYEHLIIKEKPYRNSNTSLKIFMCNNQNLSIHTHTHTHTHTYIYIYIYIYIYHHHVVPQAQISLTFSRHFSLSFIASGRSSGLHPVSSHRCCMNVRVGRPAFARPCEGVIGEHHLWTRPFFSSRVLHVWFV